MLYDIRYNIDIYGHKAKRLALQRINGVSSNPVEGELKKRSAQKSYFNTDGLNLALTEYFK